MAKVTIIATPTLRSSTERATEQLKQIRCDCLFLPLSRNLERYIVELGEGLPYQYVIEQIRKSKLIPEPVRAWEYHAEPLMMCLSQIRRGNAELQFYCYGDRLYDKISTETAMEISILILQGSSTGKIDVEKWRKSICRDVERGSWALHREADFVTRKAGQHENNVCISGLSGSYIAEQLSEEGYKVKTQYLDLPYYLTPLEILKNEMRQGEVTDERIITLVRCHIEYVKKFILTSSSVDEAYYKWSSQKTRQLRLPAVMI